MVVVFADQLRSFDLGCYGSEFVRTPNIDRLAAEGIRFEYGVSNEPVCVPARSALLSGQYARTCTGSVGNKITAPPRARAFGRSDRAKFSDPTLAERFRKMGYKTAAIGKWHIDTRPSLLGFDESIIPTLGIFTKGGFAKSEGRSFRVPGFTSDYEIAQVKNYIKANRGVPFFLYYNIISPHMPVLDVPYKYSRMYEPGEVPLRPNVWQDGKLAHDEKWFYIYLWQTWYTKDVQPVTARLTPDVFSLRELIALYDGAVTWVDDLLGEVLGSLKENGIEDNTIVVFSSDHGDMLGSHHSWNKDRVYEEAIRVPLVFRWPARLRPGVRNTTQVASLVDVMPTLLALCGGETADGMQGQDLTPILRGERTALETSHTFIESSRNEIAVRTPTHLYAATVDPRTGRVTDAETMFFDLRTDAYEQTNLAKSGQQAGLANELRAKLLAWHKSTPRLGRVAPEEGWVPPRRRGG